jgi:hypothetical protein
MLRIAGNKHKQAMLFFSNIATEGGLSTENSVIPIGIKKRFPLYFILGNSVELHIFLQFLLDTVMFCTCAAR